MLFRTFSTSEFDFKKRGQILNDQIFVTNKYFLSKRKGIGGWRRNRPIDEFLALGGNTFNSGALI